MQITVKFSHRGLALYAFCVHCLVQYVKSIKLKKHVRQITHKYRERNFKKVYQMTDFLRKIPFRLTVQNITLLYNFYDYHT